MTGRFRRVESDASQSSTPPRRRSGRRQPSGGRGKHRPNLQTLEKRELLAVDLVSVSADVTEQFDLDGVTELDSAPRELTFRFDADAEIDPATLSAFTFTASGGDDVFGNGNDVDVTPGFVGLGDSARIVIARFAGDLADDRYRISISNDPIGGLRGVDGGGLVTDPPGAASVDIDFDLNLGPRVVAVVPQPIRGGVGSRTQAVGEIEVYFDNGPMSRESAGVISGRVDPGDTDISLASLPVVNPQNYRLFLTEGTVENTDDTEIAVDRVIYDPSMNVARLQFGQNLSQLAPGGTFRLRVGSGQSAPTAPTVLVANETDPVSSRSDDSFEFAQDESITFTAGGGTQSVVFTEAEIRNDLSYVLPWPGAYENPGIREQRRDTKFTRPLDTTTGINLYPYNFASLYGLDPQGNLLDNAITPAQQQRIREVLDLFEEHLGVRFIETADSGLQFVTGDLRGVQQTADTGAGDGTPVSVFRINERDPSRAVLVLDAGENFFDGYGVSPDDRPSYFVEAIRGVANVLGIGRLFELPTGTDGAVGSPDEPNSEAFTSDGDPQNGGSLPGIAGFPTPAAEPDFLSHAAKVLGQAVNRPESDDVDFYEFTVDTSAAPGATVAGTVTIEIYAQRLQEASLLDSVLRLYRVAGTPTEPRYELVARNDDSFGHDSMINVPLSAGTYVIGVSSVGNEDYYGEKEGTATGGRSEGRYDLRISFDGESNDPANPTGLIDIEGTRLDGDADGTPGGDFNFWFRAAPDSASASPRTIFVSKDSDGAATGNGTLLAPLDTIEAAVNAAAPGDIIRLLPGLGADGELTDSPTNPNASDDNPTYEIGRGGPNDQILDDGVTLEVPRGVTVMIDAGAIVKLRDASILVGSDSVDEDRSLAALQVLGTPTSEVIITSYNQRSEGLNTNPLTVSPSAGDWGGIRFLDQVDLEEGRDTYQDEGIFVDYVSHADIRYGGGRPGGSSRSVAPLSLSAARPTLIYNRVFASAEAAISADPNSFRESLFNSPRYQRFAAGPEDYTFTSDYTRVGPEIVGNDLVANSINGLFVRVDTPTAGQIETLSVSGRFDDSDIAHIISESLEVSGNPGGPMLQEERPDVESVTLNPTAGGTISAGTYRYVVSFVTIEGQESLVSDETRIVSPTGTGNAIDIRNLPVAPEGFVGRRIYRGTVSGGVTNYELVESIDASSRRFIDRGQTRGGMPMFDAPPVSTGVALTPITGGGLLRQGFFYDYRFTFADEVGGESAASDPTTMVAALQDGRIRIDNIPRPEDLSGPTRTFTTTNVYRRDPNTGRYILIARLSNGETSIIDDGVVTGRSADTLLGFELGLDAERGTKLLPRYDARLTVDPATVVKFDNGRIEVNFGADLYAEGVPGRPVIFTSIADDTIGGSGNFDTNNDGPSGGSPGDWGGLSIRQNSTASFDYATIQFAGGDSVLEGTIRETNPLEILQANVRLTNSAILDSDGGFEENLPADDTRLGRGFNAPASIFVRGSQPILIGNVIDRGVGAAISINPDSLTSDPIRDPGRSTGQVDRFAIRDGNQGPLLEANLIAGHDINGLDIRGEVITVDSVWDDTSITHVVRDSIESLTYAYGGALRLRSAEDQSLIVKFGPNGTLVAGGRPLDITDRIGGTLQVLGNAAFPVVLTSLNDTSIGGGFTPDGLPNVNTLGNPPLDVDGNPIAAAPGDWIGLRIENYANDRNVNYVYETESPRDGDNNANELAIDAESLGQLASREYASDENARLGFNVRGTLATPGDVDTYTFRAAGRTVVTIDIDETSKGLDTVVELVTVDGDVIARSDNSRAESIGNEAVFVDETLASGVLEEDVRPLITTITSGNVESPNAFDAGMRVRLPGDVDDTRDYYVRVRTASGITEGQYTLSLRLGEDSEVAGSTIRRADIRFAQTAIAVAAAPLHSPLISESAEEVDYFDPTPGQRDSGDETTRESVDQRLTAPLGSAQPLGNLLTSDLGSLVVSGNIGNLNNSLSEPTLFNSLLDERLEDVDLYRVDLYAQQLEPDVFDNENRYVTTTFDIDYADQLGRPNTNLSVFDSQGRLILMSQDSNIADDVATVVDGSDQTRFAGGSFGTADAFIGPVELPEGTYYVAVTSAATVPAYYNQFFEENPTNPLVRLMPLNSTRRISRDSIEEGLFFDDPDTTVVEGDRFIDYVAERPIIEPNFSEDSAVDYTLDDINLFVSFDGAVEGNDQSFIAQFNPFTGTMTRLIGDAPNLVDDLAIRDDGELFSYSTNLAPGENDANAGIGNFMNLSDVDGRLLADTDDAIVFRRSNAAGNGNEADDGAQFIAQAIGFQRNSGLSSINRSAVTNNNERGWVVGYRDNQGRGGEIPLSLTRNLIYQFAGASGEITSFGSLNGNADRNFGNAPYLSGFGPASDEFEFGIVDTGQIDTTITKDGGDITGIAAQAFDFGTLAAVTDQGGIHVFNPFVTVPAPPTSEAAGYLSVIPTDFYGYLEASPDHLTAVDLNGDGDRNPVFSGLTYGPQFAEDFAYQDVLFATTPDGWLYAFTLEQDLDTGDLSVEPANVFYNGRYAVQLRFAFFDDPVVDFDPGPDFIQNFSFDNGANGLAFSTLEVNPWHVTSDRFGELGHGQVTPYDLSRQPLGIGGGTSLYFGFEVEATNFATGPTTNVLGRSETDPLGQVSPGGAHGSIVSQSIDLSEYSAADKPTLYFTYHVDVEENGPNGDDYFPFGANAQSQRDSFRVFGAGADGQYRLLATNDEFRSLANADEYDEFFRVPDRDLDADPNFEAGIPVQEIFDDIPATQWRQARVDLSPFAGDRDVKIRFDVSTAGGRIDQLGSIEFVARDGEVLNDNATFSLADDEFNGVLFENVIGRDLIFPAASNTDGLVLRGGDSFTVTDADGVTTIVRFVTAPSAVITPGVVEVVIDPAANADQVAADVAAVLPTALAPRIDGGGRLSLLKASSVVVDANIAVADTAPVAFSDPGSPILITPNAQEAVEGEQVTVVVGGVVNTFTYVRDVNATGSNLEFVFDETITDPSASDVSVAIEVSQKINAIFGPVSFVADGDVQFTDPSVLIAVFPGPTEITFTPVPDPDVRIEIEPGVELNDDETILLTDNFGDQFAVVLDDDGNVPAGIVPGGATSIVVPFANGDSATVVRDRIVNAINAAAPQFNATPTNAGDGTPTALLVDATDFDRTQRPNPLSASPVGATLIQFPSANQIVDGEQITIQTPTFTRTVTFSRSFGPSQPDIVTFTNGDSPGQIIDRFVNIALEGLFPIGVQGNRILFYDVDPSNVTFSNVNSAFQPPPDAFGNRDLQAIDALLLDIPAGDELNDRDTFQIGSAAIPGIVDARVFTLVDEAVNPIADEPNELGFLPSDSATDVRALIANEIIYSFDTVGPGGQIQLFVPGDDLLLGTPDAGVSTLRFESFIEIELPGGTGLRTGEVLTIFTDFGDGDSTNDLTQELVFVRNGDSFAPSPTQIVIPFDEDDSPDEVGLEAANRINAVLPQFVAVPLANGFGLAARGSDALVTFDPVFTSQDVTDPVETYALQLTIPRGNLIEDGDTFTVFRRDQPRDQFGTTYTFSQTADPLDLGDNTIVYSDTDSAAQVAAAVLRELDGVLRPIVSPISDRVIFLINASGIESDSAVQGYRPAVDTGINGFIGETRAIPVLFTQDDPSTVVATALTRSFADGLGAFTSDDPFFEPAGPLTTTATPFNYKIEAGDRIRLWETFVTDPGEYGLNTFLPGDEFGTGLPISISPGSRNPIPAANNTVEGVYIDDIIIGFAERGEAVIYDNYLAAPSNTQFDLNPSFTPDTRGADSLVPTDEDQPENPDEVLVGPYRLEVRLGDRYGVPQDYDPINLVLDENLSAGRAFDTNDRLADGAVSLVMPAGSDLIDGDTFTLDDGLRSLTFEFNSVFDDADSTDQVGPANVAINFSPADTAVEIARKTRDAINFEQFSGGGGSTSDTGLRIVAVSGDGRTAGETSSRRIELFGENIVVNPGFADPSNNDKSRTIRVDAVEAETPFGDFTGQRIPVVDQDSRTVVYANFGDELANATVTDYLPGDTLIASGKIGDQILKGIFNNVSGDDGQILFSDPTRDVDVFRIFLDGGSRIDLDVDTSGLYRDSTRLTNPIVTIFPAGTVFEDGENLALDQNTLGQSNFFFATADDGETEAGATLQFQAPQTGYYDIAVSSRFAFDNGFTNFFDPTDVASGEYQLTVRPSVDLGVPNRDVIFVDYQFGETDVNRFRDQGQLIIERNIIRDSADFGIDASINDRGLAATTADNGSPILGPAGNIGPDGLPRPGSASLLRNQNTFGLIPGTVLVNNLIIDNDRSDLSDPDNPFVDNDSSVGIRIAGGTFNNDQAPAPNVFSRVINNTVVGDSNGTGIVVDGRAAPTLVNNVIVDVTDGFDVDTTTAGRTETASNVFAGVTNPSTVPIGQTSIVLPDAVGLFQQNDDGTPVYIPADGSVLIDSSVQSISDRADLFNTVKQSVGIAPSPILAPELDANGNARVDTPGQGDGGIGANVFADRGALDRSDNRGPVARLTTPLDSIGTVSSAVDSDPAPAVIRLTEDISLPFFEIELSDLGVGIDPATVTPNTVVFTENGNLLVEGRDYRFGFSSAGTTIRLTATRGEFRRDATYQISLSRSIEDLADNPLQPTTAGDRTLLTIVTAGVGFDLGDAPSSYGTTAMGNGPSHAGAASGGPILGDRVDLELDATPTALANGDDRVAMLMATTASPAINVTQTTGSLAIDVVSIPADGSTIDFTLGSDSFTVEFVLPTSNPQVGSVVVDLDAGAADTPATVATALETAIRTRLAGSRDGVQVAAAPAASTVLIESFDDEDGVPIGVFNTGGRNYFVFGNPQPDGTIDPGDVLGVLTPGEQTTFVVNASNVGSGPAFLDAWIDFEVDGVFGREDRIATAFPLVDGPNLITVTTPAGISAPVDTYARFRISTLGNLPPTGVASGGEVEDHLVSIAATNLGLPVNNPPSFDTASPLELLEADDDNARVIDNFVTNILPGGPDNTVENTNQQVVGFSIAAINDPSGILIGNPSINYTPGDDSASLSIATRADQIGTVTFSITATDDDPNNPLSTTETVTINIRPVNDPPVLDPAVSGASDRSNAQDFADSYVVDATEPRITYTIREDNIQGDLTEPAYFIPLAQASGAGYSRIGLLDLFTVGPANELTAIPGGSQELTITLPGGGSFQTALGGSVDPVFSGGTLVGLDYTPPQDLNLNFSSEDSFVFTVTDNSTTGGETFDPTSGTLVEDNRSTTGEVRIRLLPVNDAPSFVLADLPPVQEDTTLIRIEGFAQDIVAGPAGSAFDENDVLNGQQVEFAVTSLSFDDDLADEFFSVFPTINADTGELVFQPAPNVFGSFDFEVVLSDDGPEPQDTNPTGDLNSSEPQIITIDVNPVNDAPQLRDDASPIVVEVDEDGSVTFASQALVDVFQPGPTSDADFGADVDPTDESVAGKVGAGQTVMLSNTIPTSTSQGGSLSFDPGTGLFTYEPRENFVGTDEFIYSVVDNGISVVAGGDQDDPSDREADPRLSSGTVTITVNPINDVPQFSGAADVEVDEDAGSVTIPNWVTGVRPGPATAADEAVNQTLQFELSLVGGDASILSTPPSITLNGDGTADLMFNTATDASGSVSYSVVLVDDGPGDAPNVNRTSPPQIFTITIGEVGDPPTFRVLSETVTVAEDSGAFATVLVDNISPGPANESDQTVSFRVTLADPNDANKFDELPTIDSSGLLRFVLADDANTFDGAIAVTIIAEDSGGAVSDAETLTLNITPINDVPIAVADAVSTDEDSVLRLTPAQLLNNDIDPDLIEGDSLTVDLLIPASTDTRFSQLGAAVRTDPITGEIIYDPTTSETLQETSTGQQRIDTFTYQAVDASGSRSNVATVTLSVAGRNDAPIANPDNPTLNPDGDTIIDVLANDVDVDGTIATGTLAISFQPSFGTAFVDRSTGQIVYTPVAGVNRSDEFRYTVRDNEGLISNEGVVTVAANAAPIAVGDAAVTLVDTIVVIDVAENDSDPDGTLVPGSVQIVSDPLRGDAFANGDGTITYSPDTSFRGRDTLRYVIFDDQGRSSNVATVRIDVRSSNLQNPSLRPDVNDDSRITPIDALLIINYLRRNNSSVSVPVGNQTFDPDADPPIFYFDVNGDQDIEPVDALTVINFLRRNNGVSGEQIDSGRNDLTVIDTASPIVNFIQPRSSFELAQQIDVENVLSKALPADMLVDDDVLASIATGIPIGDDDDRSEASVDRALGDWDLRTFRDAD